MAAELGYEMQRLDDGVVRRITRCGLKSPQPKIRRESLWRHNGSFFFFSPSLFSALISFHTLASAPYLMDLQVNEIPASVLTVALRKRFKRSLTFAHFLSLSLLSLSPFSDFY